MSVGQRCKYCGAVTPLYTHNSDCPEQEISRLKSELAASRQAREDVTNHCLQVEAKLERAEADLKRLSDTRQRIIDGTDGLTIERDTANELLRRVDVAGYLICVHSDIRKDCPMCLLHAEIAAHLKPKEGQPDPGKCMRCGAPYLPHGQCSRWREGCQGGRGDNPHTNPQIKVTEYPSVEAALAGKPAHLIIEASRDRLETIKTMLEMKWADWRREGVKVRMEE